VDALREYAIRVSRVSRIRKIAFAPNTVLCNLRAGRRTMQQPRSRKGPGWDATMTVSEADSSSAHEAPSSSASSSNYDIEGEHARGGLGRVLRAWDRRLNRPVALKELLALRAEHARRFAREVEITARLQHPNIVPVYEAGRWANGTPFYAMKFVSGRTLRQLISEAHTLDERLALLPNVLAVADAIAYAHSEGIVHRDLKPSNVLVGLFGETVVVDWGLAKDLRDSNDDATGADPYRSPADGHTVAGTVLGTPSYMPPEQARGADVDERADVYALGALLYHTLAGRAPYTGETSATIIDRVIAGPPTPIDTSVADVAPDLAAIIDTAMARDPGDRYANAGALADDLRRFQTGQLVSAHRYSRTTLLARWARRNRAALLVALSLLVVLAAAVTVSVRRIVHERDAAERERSLATERAHALTLTQARTSLAIDPTSAVAWIKSYPASANDQATAHSIVADAVARGVASFAVHATSRVRTAALSPDGRHFAVGGGGPAVEEWILPSSSPARRAFDTTTMVLEYSPDGRTLAAAGEYGRLVAWTEGVARELVGHRAMIVQLAFSADGRTLLSTDVADHVWLWDLANGGGRELAFADASSTRVTFAGGTTPHAVVAIGNELALWDVSRRVRARSVRVTTKIDSLAVAEGALVVAAKSGERLSVWSLATVKRIADIEGRPGLAGFVLNREGTRLAYWYNDRSVQVRNLEDGSTQRLDAGQRMFAVRFSPDNDLLAVGGVGGTVTLWDLAADSIQTLSGHTGILTHFAFSHDGKSLLSCAADDSDIRIWPVRRQARRVFRELPGIVLDATFSPDGRSLATASSGGLARIWNAATGASTLLVRHRDIVQDVAFSADGRLFAAASWDGVVSWSNLESGATGRLSHGARAQRVRWLPDGARLATASMDGAISIWTIADGKRVILGKHEGPVGRLQLSPDGKTLLTAGDDRTIRIWHIASLNGRVLGRHDDEITRATFTPDGGSVIALSADGAARRWDVASGRWRALPKPGGRYGALAVSPDGALIAAGGDDGTILLWRSAAVEREPRVLRGHQAAVRNLAFSPDGRWLASSSSDRTARLWDPLSGDQVVLRGHDAFVRGLAFSPDGTVLATTSADATTRLWPLQSFVSVPADESRFRDFVAQLTNLVVANGAGGATR
jgi:WD40 repeat protein